MGGGPERPPIGGVAGVPQDMQEHAYLDMDCYPNTTGGELGFTLGVGWASFSGQGPVRCAD